MGKVQTGLTHIEVNTITGKEESTKNKDVKDNCHDENRIKFSHTFNTPLIHGQIFQGIGFEGNSERCLNIL